VFINDKAEVARREGDVEVVVVYFEILVCMSGLPVDA